MANLLMATPHSEATVQASYSEPETATADKNGVLRDDEGRAFSAGVYEVVER